MTLPLIGFILGDWTGIGPEQCARVLADGQLALIDAGMSRAALGAPPTCLEIEDAATPARTAPRSHRPGRRGEEGARVGPVARVVG